MDQSTNRHKGVEGPPISVGVEARAEACGAKTPENEIICTGKIFYSIALLSIYKETEFQRTLTMTRNECSETMLYPLIN